MTVEMRVDFPGGKKVNAQYKDFVIQTDQPSYAGGDGSAPAPFDLFLASIATCSGLYVLAFCERRGISLDSNYLVMKPRWNPDKKMIEKIDIEIHLPSEFPDRYKNAVIKAVDSCSVKNHIINPPSFEIRVLKAAPANAGLEEAKDSRSRFSEKE